MNAQTEHVIVIWRIIDGKPGHENQSLGLVNALQNKTACIYHDIHAQDSFEALFCYLSSTWPAGKGLPLPDLIIGAGHRTHMHMLAAQKVYGGKTIVLMKPSMPTSWFNLCLIPEHDNYNGLGNHIEVKGVLNTIRSSSEHQANHSLIMVGGPSRHYSWNSDELLSQIKALLEHNPQIDYVLTTSRRTPDLFLTMLEQLVLTHSNLKVVPFDQTKPGWVDQQLAISGTAWITEDSVSMIYEALTAQASVGLLSVPIKKKNRVSNGVKQLIDNGYTVRFDYQQNYKRTFKPATGFMEAERCANWLLANWFTEPVHIAQPILQNA